MESCPKWYLIEPYGRSFANNGVTLPTEGMQVTVRIRVLDALYREYLRLYHWHKG